MMRVTVKYFQLLLITLLFNTVVLSQDEGEPVRVVGDLLIGKTLDGESVREVTGNVVMTQGKIRIDCDTAIQFIARNEVKLLGNVIASQDSVNIYSDMGYYYGNSKMAYSDTGVLLDDGQMNLTAKVGYYYFNEKKAIFSNNVELIDSVNTLNSDKLTYFHDEDKAIAVGNVSISDSVSNIRADSLNHLRKIDNSEAFGHVKISSTENNIVITGDELLDIGEEKYTRITGNTLLTQIDTSEAGLIDTLVIKAGMMESVIDSSKKLIAIDSVKIVRGDFSSLNEKSIYFSDEDKIFTFRKSETGQPPVLWQENSQLVGDSIYIYLLENELKKIFIVKNAFIISQNKNYKLRFDQISGDSITLIFDKKRIAETNVSGNVLSLYYMFEEDEPNGLLKSSGERAKISFIEGKIQTVKLFGTPASEYHPEILVEGKEKNFTLPSFILYKNRPKKEDLIQNEKNKNNNSK